MCVAELDEPAPENVESEGGCALESAFFAFDDSSLDEGARRSLQRDAVCLARQPDARWRLIGRGDPRGVPEYNLDLATRRAQSVLRYLVNLGAVEDRFDVRGVPNTGAGGDETHWRFDRRVDFERVVGAARGRR